MIDNLYKDSLRMLVLDELFDQKAITYQYSDFELTIEKPYRSPSIYLILTNLNDTNYKIKVCIKGFSDETIVEPFDLIRHRRDRPNKNRGYIANWIFNKILYKDLQDYVESEQFLIDTGKKKQKDTKKTKQKDVYSVKDIADLQPLLDDKASIDSVLLLRELIDNRFPDLTTIDNFNNTMKNFTSPILMIDIIDAVQTSARLIINFSTTNGYSMSSVTIKSRYRLLIEPKWKDLSDIEFVDGELHYVKNIEDLLSMNVYEVEVSLVDINNPYLSISAVTQFATI